ncbi:hypothetical protein BT69DRAFT_1350176 [Atractiella rhizophila]|nr:hypothetical protein BT69DRAFT_1350176 [Atractiella rhizophila]
MNIFGNKKPQNDFDSLPSSSSHLTSPSSYRTNPIYPLLPLRAQPTSLAYASPPDLLCITYTTPSAPLVQILSTNGPIVATFPIPGATARGAKTAIRGSWIVGRFVFVLDEKETLWGWNLEEMDGGERPKRAWTRSLRGRCTMITPNPSLKHIFIGYQDGTIETFHVERGTISEYSIPNLWQRVDAISQMTVTGPNKMRRRVPPITDIKVSPVDLNRLLIAYDGGIVLYSLKDKAPIHYYELIVPPGAKGGSNSGGEELFTERRPAVMCLSWRYDAQMFAAGYADGSIAFWATDFPDKPLAVRTLGGEDVNLVDPDSMFDEPDPSVDEGGEGKVGAREPVFKLSWCHADGSVAAGAGEQAGGGTTDCLLVLGGTMRTERKGVWYISSVFYSSLLSPSQTSSILRFPKDDPINPKGSNPDADPPSSPTGASAKLARQEALRSLIYPSKSSCLFPTSSNSSPHLIPYEYQLLSPSSPHYDGAHNPKGIVIIVADSRAAELERSVRAFEFEVGKVVGKGWSKEPRRLAVPLCLEWLGDGALVEGKVYDVPKQTVYQRMTKDANTTARLNIMGGRAMEGVRSAERGMKAFLEGAKEVIVGWHLDGKVRFYDVSPHLLQDPHGALRGVNHNQGEAPAFSGRIKELFPKPLDHLTIDLEAKELKEFVKDQEWIVDVQLAKETWDCAVLLKGGKTIVFRLGQTSAPRRNVRSSLVPTEAEEDEGEHLHTTMTEAMADLTTKDSSPSAPSSVAADSSSPRPSQSSRLSAMLHKQKPSPSKAPNALLSAHHIEHVDLRHNYYPSLASAVQPIALISGGSGKQDGKLCLSDMGFVAGSGELGLWIIDLRDGDWIWRDSEEVVHVSKEREKERKGKDWGEAILLQWAVCELSTDRMVSPRLLVAYTSGHVRILTLSYSLSTWTVNTHHTTSVTVRTPLLSLYVMDHHCVELRGTPETLEVALAFMEDPTLATSRKDEEAKSYLYSVSQDGTVEVFSGVNGSRVLKKSTDSELVTSSYIHQSGDSALLLVQRNGRISSFSLPHLEEDNRIGIMTPSDAFPLDRIHITPSTGDFIYPSPGGAMEIYSIFDFNRPSFPPNMKLVDGHVEIPPHPTKNNILMSQVEAWSNWWAGKDGETAVSDGRTIDELLGGPEPDPPPTVTSKLAPKRASTIARRPAADAASGSSNPFEHTQEALEERENRLANVQEALEDIGKGASEMIKEAKRVAAQQALKQGVAGWFSKNFT